MQVLAADKLDLSEKLAAAHTALTNTTAKMEASGVAREGAAAELAAALRTRNALEGELGACQAGRAEADWKLAVAVQKNGPGGRAAGTHGFATQ